MLIVVSSGSEYFTHVIFLLMFKNDRYLLQRAFKALLMEGNG